MPYKDKTKRREASKRFYYKHKEQKKLYKKIQSQTLKAHPTRQLCSVNRCTDVGERHHPDYSKPTEIIWLCKKHHEEEHHGSSKCKICGDKSLARGFCNKHYKEQRKISEPEYAERTKKIRKEYKLKFNK